MIPPIQENRRSDSASSDINETLENLNARLKNTSFDASRQRKLNKTLQTDNENLTKNLQSLTEKYKIESHSLLLFIFYLYRLTHTERDIASKRTLIENYKTRLNELETNTIRANDKITSEVISLIIH